MDRSHRSDDGAQHVLALQVLFRDVGGCTNRVMSAPNQEEREDLGSDAGGRGGGGVLVLRGAINPQQILSLPESRNTNDAPPMSTLKLRLVMPIVISVTSGSSPSHSGMAAITAASAGSNRSSTPRTLVAMFVRGQA